MARLRSVSAQPTLLARARAFVRGDEGSLAPLVLIMLVLMILFGGIAIDVMRFETKRVAVQNTLDRASLAAANLQNTLDPEFVVRDHFIKAGLESSLGEITVDQGLNYRTITARAEVVSRNIFMQMFDIDTLSANNLSRAEQRITNVEISLVLDVSGSMFTKSSRIENLKRAAKSFVETMLKGDNPDKISISIVPYNGQVNLGPELLSLFNVTDRHSFPNSYCLDLPTNTWTTTDISRTTPMPQAPFLDTTTSTGDTPDINNRGLYSNAKCNPVAANYVSLYQNDANRLKAQIEGLTPVGATSIHLGLKWGVAMLDPSAKPLVQSMANLPSNNPRRVSPLFANRPALYGDPENLKVIILMTDGANFLYEEMKDGYRTGESNVFVYNNDYKIDNLSVFVPSRLSSSNNSTRCAPYYSVKERKYYPKPYAGSRPASSPCYQATDSLPKGVTHAKWEDLHPKIILSSLASKVLAPAHGDAGSTWLNKMRSQTPIATMDARVKSICDRAKTKNIVIYSIAFEAEPAGKQVLRDCANWPETTYYFDVISDGSGVNLTNAFDAIASNLSQLRLTQ